MTGWPWFRSPAAETQDSVSLSRNGFQESASRDLCPVLACAVQRRRFPVGANPTRQPLQPEAIGAVMEATKWLKPSISLSQSGGSMYTRKAYETREAQGVVSDDQPEAREGQAGRLGVGDRWSFRRLVFKACRDAHPAGPGQPQPTG